MIIGQLYYYNTQLNQLEQNLIFSFFLLTEIIGLWPNTFQAGTGIDEYLLSSRDKFIIKYEEYLISNELRQSAWIWSTITSPRTIPENSENNLDALSEYSQQIINWFNSGSNIKDLLPLINTGSITSEETDYSLYYGLRVLYLISALRDLLRNSINTSKDANYELISPNAIETATREQDPEIIIVTGKEYAPLFATINTIWVPSDSKADLTFTLSQVNKTLEKYNTIQLILIDSAASSDSEKLQQLIAKNLVNKNIFVYPVSLNFDGISSFFDEIVKHTLGIRL